MDTTSTGTCGALPDVEGAGAPSRRQQQQQQQQEQQRRRRRLAVLFRRLWRYAGPGWLVCVAYLDPGNLFSDILSGSQYAYSQLWVVWWSQWFALFVGWLCARLVLRSSPLEDFASAERKRYRKPPAARYFLWLFAELVVIIADIPEVIGFAFGIHILTGLPVWAGVLLSFLATSLVLLLELGDFRLVEMVVALCVFALGLVLLVSLAKSGLDGKAFMVGWLLPRFQGGQSVYDALSIIGSVVMPHNLYLQTGSLIAHHTAAFVALDIIDKVHVNETGGELDARLVDPSFTKDTDDNGDGDADSSEQDVEAAAATSATLWESDMADKSRGAGSVQDIAEDSVSVVVHAAHNAHAHWSVDDAQTQYAEPGPDAGITCSRSDHEDTNASSGINACTGERARERGLNEPLCDASNTELDEIHSAVVPQTQQQQVEEARCIGPLGADGSSDITVERTPVHVLAKGDFETSVRRLSGKTLEQENTTERQGLDVSSQYQDGLCAPAPLPAVGAVVLELVLPTCFAFFVNASAIAIAAEHVFSQGSSTSDSLGLYNFCKFLPFDGACILWGIILILSGTASTVTTTLTGSYVMSGFLHLRIPMLVRAALARGLALTPALIIAATSGPATVNAIIGVVNATLSIALPIVLVPLLRCSHERRKLHWFPHAAGWLFTAFIFGLNLYGLCAPQGGMFGLYTGSSDNFTWSVQANILQDLVVLSYTAIVVWLAVS
jgi:Mn2+/Fe2+ NRAMP family transporter